MGFTWPAPRHDPRGNTGALLTAAALTAFGAAAMSGPLAPLYHVGRGASTPSVPAASEVVTFVTPAHSSRPPLSFSADDSAARRTSAAPARRTARLLGEASLRPAPASPALPVVASTANSPTTHVPAESSPSSAGAPTAGAAAGAAASPVFTRPSAFAASRSLGREQRDSVLSRLSRAVPRLAATRRPTRAERDSLWRQEARRQAEWREQGRPIPIIAGTGTISLPLFASGPSRERRMRDSVVHRDNLLRLARLAERGRVEEDSTRGAAARPGMVGAPVP